MKRSASTSDPNTELHGLVSRLRNRDSEVQADAVREAVALGPKGMEALLLAIQQQRKPVKQMIYFVVSLLAAWILGFVSAIILSPSSGLRFLYLAAGSLTTFLVYEGLIAIADRPTLILHRLMNLISQVDDQRKTGLFVEALHDCSLWPQDEETVKKSLTPMLLTLRSSDIGVLSQHQRQLLCKAFSFSIDGVLQFTFKGDRELYLAILKAFEQIGGSSEMAVVEKLARLKSGDDDSDSKAIRLAAQTCLPLLRQNAILEKDRLALLRGSSAPVDGARLLLHPAEGVTYVAPEELLRANSDSKYEA
jgi:hypothetical protein